MWYIHTSQYHNITIHKSINSYYNSYYNPYYNPFYIHPYLLNTPQYPISPYLSLLFPIHNFIHKVIHTIHIVHIYNLFIFNFIF